MGALQYRNFWNEVKLELFEKLIIEPLKGEGKYIHGKLKTQNKRIKTNFHGKDVPYDMYCNAAALLKIYYVNKKVKPIIPRYLLKSVNTLMQTANNVVC